MNNNLNEQSINESQCCVDYCATSFNVDGTEVVNRYPCNQKQFSPADLWNIQKNRRNFSIK